MRSIKKIGRLSDILLTASSPIKHPDVNKHTHTRQRLNFLKPQQQQDQLINTSILTAP